MLQSARAEPRSGSADQVLIPANARIEE